MINENPQEQEQEQEQDLVIIDKANPCYSTICLDTWLGQVFEDCDLNEYLDDEPENLQALESLQDYIDENPRSYSYGSSDIGNHSDKILEVLEKITEDRYEYHTSGYSENEENDLDGSFTYDIFTPSGSGDWIWSQDTIVVVNGVDWYKVDNLGDSGFFDRVIGYHATDVSGDYVEVQEIETGYSSYPYEQIHNLYAAKHWTPILKWSDKFKGFLARHVALGQTHILTPYLHIGN
jgi:hypothetical protein